MTDLRRASAPSRSLMLLIAGLLAAPAAGATQVACSLAETPVLDFGQPVINPTPQVEATATVRVDCVGDDAAAGQALEVCVLAAPGAQPAMRRPPSMLRYGLFADVAHTQPLAHPTGAASAVVRMGDAPNVAAQARLAVYGVIPAGQDGLSGGLHQDRVPLQIRVATRPGERCTTAPARATGFLEVRAEPAAGSCSVRASDLDFGRAFDLARGMDGQTALGLTCSAGTAYSVSLGGGTVGQDVHRRRMGPNGGPGAASVVYQLYQDSARSRVWGQLEPERVSGTGTGSPQTLPVFARVPAQATPPAGAYFDVITATVTF